MPARPNFTDVQLDGDKVRVFGESNADDLADIVGIQVFLTQEGQGAGGSAKMAMGFVPVGSASWDAEFDANGLVAGPAAVIGVETHSTPFTTISWVQPVEISG
jgi:hypothetical protein